MGSKGWGFLKVRSAFPYFLFLVSYSLFPCVFAPLRALRETKPPQSPKGGILKHFPFISIFVLKKSLRLCSLASFARNKAPSVPQRGNFEAFSIY
jgi:hypothetical protein